ncbi:hypothetical protein MIR68_008151 [Amoeboaphelidium protococcarum]|nr:hypothetical protein MIR68_008151 [Amoeboaphelidium protococcarum]
MNAPARHEIIVLPDGVKKITVKQDIKIPNAATFEIQREDHTLGNVLREYLLQNPKVLFAAYKMPHPLNPWIELKVQVTADTTPRKAVIQALNRIIIDGNHMSAQFKQEIERFQRRRGIHQQSTSSYYQ